ncbi:unnamed protein product [Ostreobium quekettii]|uniref:Holocytochrome c-type synthase n=1 Tax=Ostreobium quekettii TaxID=121088 RepID=A0A8S1J2W9_9CHLO|nr:unnamed protein product [Ostreobium quekettii]|eukprot:evm.model.scf_185.10 EVM.evm.TU.scf_185.10   scf_185:98724-102297(+)
MGAATSTPASNGDPDGATTSACPVPPAARGAAVYNVYNQRVDGATGGGGVLDPRNNMPLQPSNRPSPGQRAPLSAAREVSMIPKGGTDGTWLYPSPQMFYNALKRKGKMEGVTEDVMDSVVHAHNTLNEATWRRVRDWEHLHQECGNPKLLRFVGRPDSLSPHARVNSWMGGALPFDRHDWFVDRCGKEVRYVIDFYFADEKAGTPEAFVLDVRPALDSFGAALDRIKMTIYSTFAAYGLPCPVTGHKRADAEPAGALEPSVQQTAYGK